MARDASLSEAYWLGLVDRFRNEGGSLTEFCCRADVTPQAFRKWQRHFKQQAQSVESPFVEVAIHDDNRSAYSSAMIEIQFSREIIVRVPCDQVALRTVLLTLKEQHAC